MGIMNKVHGGADLTKPHLSGGWLITAIFSVIALAIAFAIGLWTYRKGKTIVTGATGSTGTITAGDQTGMSGIFGDGT